MPDDARAFWIAAAGRGEVRTEALAMPGPDDVVVRALFSGISRGTEALVFAGRVPPAERERMRAPFQQGDFPAPVKYGYSMVGRVEHGPDGLIGRNVFVLHPHQTRFVVPARSAYVLPDAVPPARAVLAANLETAVNGVWDARPHVGDRIAVIGGGTVGCLAAWLVSRIPGCKVELVDRNPSRAVVADALKVPFAQPSAVTRGADLVIHASGNPEGLELALKMAARDATIVELSWFGDQKVSLPLGGAFHSKRLTIASSQVGHLPPSQRPRWDTRRRMTLALELLRDEDLDVLITGESDFEAMPEVMAGLARSPGDTLCHRIRYL
jgi:2-desacetyl-2-hydroxyethyl bacteriochlorophyllide A dehydrogenase